MAEKFNCLRKKTQEAVWLFYTCKVAGTNKGGNPEILFCPGEEVPVFGPNEKKKPTGLQEALARWCQHPSCCSFLYGVLSKCSCSLNTPKMLLWVL